MIPKRLVERGIGRELRRAVNQLSDEVKALRLMQGVGYKVKRTALGTILNISGNTSTGQPSDLEIAAFVVSGSKKEYWLGKRLEIQEETFVAVGNEIAIAKPKSLVWDTNIDIPEYTTAPSISIVDTDTFLSRSLSYSSGGEPWVIAQKIVPQMTVSAEADPSVGTIIWAVTNADPGINQDDEDDNPILWLDLNVDARRWEWQALKVLQVCVDDTTTKRILALATDPVN